MHYTAVIACTLLFSLTTKNTEGVDDHVHIAPGEARQYQLRRTPPPGMPDWDWDTVKTYVHCGNTTGSVWNADAMAVLANQSFVVFEKMHAALEDPVGDDAEGKIMASCKQLKRTNPRVRCLIYTETDWARTYFRAGHDFDVHVADGWELRCHTGWLSNTTELVERRSSVNPTTNKIIRESATFTHRFYNFSSVEARTRWVQRVTNIFSSDGVDGVFIDGERSNFEVAAVRACVNDIAEYERWCAGLKQAHEMMKAALPSNATLIVNYPARDLLSRFATGGMIERFIPSGKFIVLLQDLVRMGILVQVHAEYIRMNSGPNSAIESGIAFHLAAFLIGMGHGSYFGAGKGWHGSGATACWTWLHIWDEYKKPLGKPIGDAVVVQGSPPLAVWTREFATGTHVLFNGTRAPNRYSWTWRESCSATIWWSDGTTSGDDSNVPFKWPMHDEWLQKFREPKPHLRAA